MQCNFTGSYQTTLPAQKFSCPPSSTTTSPLSIQHSLHPTLTHQESWLLSLSLVNEEALLQTFSASTGNDPYRTSVAMENHH